jgi:UDP-3-O-[3-hydroxymyristoyl] glucosamine N-acyltransferase
MKHTLISSARRVALVLLCAAWTLLVPAPSSAQSPPVRTWHIQGQPPVRAQLLRVTGGHVPQIASFAVLKLDDGRIRAFNVQLLSEADRQVVRARPSAKSPANRSTAAFKANFTEYQPKRDPVEIHETEHFVFYWGRTISDGAKAWSEESFRNMNFAYFEQVWDFFVEEMQLPIATARVNDKINVYITGTGLAKHPDGFAFAAHDIIIHPTAMAAGSSVIPHEFGHCLQLRLGGFRNSDLVGWFWECHANYVSHLFIPEYPPALDGYADRAHYELNSSRMNYGSWMFLNLLAEHPRLGPAFPFQIWHANRKNEHDQSIEDPFQTIMRHGVQRGAFKGNGVEDFGDIIGTLAARNATWDHPYQQVYRHTLDQHDAHVAAPSWRRTLLSPVPDRPGWFRPAYASHLPRQFGYNVIDLIPRSGATRIAVNLQGIVDEVEQSDWRATIVVVDSSGRARYSPMFRTGNMEMKITTDDQAAMLAIAATPRRYVPLGFRIGFNQKRRYPYELAFTDCQPASEPPRRITSKDIDGSPHPNGGGFVAKSATVEPSVFVGPDAMVLGSARVTGQARIEDHAVVTDSAHVSEEAIVGGWALVCEEAKVIEQGRVDGCARVAGRVTVGGRALVTDYVRVHDEGRIVGDALIKGFGDVHTHPDAAVGGTVIMGEDLEVHLVDAPRPLNHGLIYGFMAREQFENEVHDDHGLAAWYRFNEPRRRIVYDNHADFNGVLRGAAIIAAEGTDGSLKLDGTGYALLDAGMLDTADFTIQMRLKWDGGVAEQRLMEVVGEAGRLSVIASDRAGRPRVEMVRGGKTVSVIGDQKLVPGKWMTLTIIRDDGRLELYVDGRRTGPALANPPRLSGTGPGHTYLGRGESAEAARFRGTVDEVAIYRRSFDNPGSIPGRVK